MKLNILFLLFLSSLSILVHGQQLHWISIEEDNFEDFSLQLEIIHHPSIANEEWIRVNIHNKTEKQWTIKQASYEVQCSVFDKKDQLINQGRFHSKNPSEFMDDMTENLLSSSQIKPGISSISHYPSAYGASILKMPKDGYYKVKAKIFLTLDLEGDQNISIQWEDIAFEFDWYRPNPKEISRLQARLQKLLTRPQLHPYHHHSLTTFLQIDEIAEKTNLQQLLDAKDKRYDFTDGRIAITRHLNEKYANEDVLKEYYFQKIKAKDIQAVSDLPEAPDVWDKRYFEPLQSWFNEGNLSIKYRIINILFPNIDKWKKDEVCRQLSDKILELYGDILFATPSELSAKDLLQWVSLATILSKTGDPEAIGVLCPFLSSKEQILSQDIQIDPQSTALPRPYRVKDVALECILRLQGKNVENQYYKAGFNPPYFYGEVNIVVDRIRNQMVEQLLSEDTCNWQIKK